MPSRRIRPEVSRAAAAAAVAILTHTLGQRVAVERYPAGRQLVQDDARAPRCPCARSTSRGRLHLLGRHVKRRAHHGRCLRHAHVGPGPAQPRHLRDPEVEDLDREEPVVSPDAEQIGRLQIAVDDPQPVRVGDGLARLQDELDGLLDRKRPSLLKPRAEVAALQVLHHHVRSAGLQRPDVDDARHVLALDLDRRASFPREPRHGFGIAQRVGKQELDRHPLVELDVVGSDDDAHAARAEDLVDAVLAGEDVALTNARHDFGRTAAHARHPRHPNPAPDST